MGHLRLDHASDRASTNTSDLAFEDPLEGDQPTDRKIEVTRRGLVRLAVAAVHTGVRFERERLAGDPVAWMLAPRQLFDGESAVDACIDLAPMTRCIALHAPGACAGLDLDPGEIDAVCRQSGFPGDGVFASDRSSVRKTSSRSAALAGSAGRGHTGPRLFSCSIVRMEPGARVLTFVAGVADSERDFRRRLFDRFGAMAALTPDVRHGFDQYDPMAVALVSERLADWLATIAAEPERCGAGGLDVVIEQRVLA